MNGRARTANTLPIGAGLVLLALALPGALAADVPQQQAEAAKKPKAAVEPQVTPEDASQAPESPVEMSPEAKRLTETPTEKTGSFKPPPPYPAYDASEELAVYVGKHLNDTVNPPVDVGLALYDRGAYAPRPTFFGEKNPVYFHFMAYGDMRTAVADNDTGVKFANGKTFQSQVATRLNLDLDLNLTPTERIHAFMRPFDQGGMFTRYDIDGGVKDKFFQEFNSKLLSLFFEGDLGNILGGILGRPSKFDLPFAGGLVPIFTQNGIWIQDTFRGFSFATTAKNSKALDISNFDVTFFTALDGATSPAFNGHGSAKIYGLAGFADLLKGYLEAGYGYVDAQDKDLSYHNVTAAFTTRIEGTVSNSVRLIGNFGQKGPLKTANGLLVLVENSLITSRPLTLVPYLNLFAGFDSPQSLARALDVGGVLANTGINFQSDGLTGFPTLDAGAHDSYGGALGVEYLFELQRQIVFEGAAVERMRNNPLGAQYAFGASYQQPINNAWIVRVDGMRGWLDGLLPAGTTQRDIYGVRLELRRKF